MSDYVQKNELGAYRIGDTRVSLDSVVYSYNRGNLPEFIVRQFPALTLEQVYGAIAFYLSKRDEIDEYLREGEAEFEKMRSAQIAADPRFYERFDQLREEWKKGNLARR